MCSIQRFSAEEIHDAAWPFSVRSQTHAYRPGKLHPQLIQDALPAETIEGVLDSLQVTFRRRLYTPVVTMWLWLGQVFSADGSIRNAVAKAFAWLVAGGQEACSTDCSPYSRARNRLPEAVPEKVAQKVAEEMEPKAVDPRFGRRVWLSDGTICQAADTEANQKKYPQPPGQKKGCGFPMVPLMGMFSLITGAVRDLAIGSYYESEHALFRALWDRLQSTDIVVADSLFNSYVHITLLLNKGVDVLFRQDRRRKSGFRKGKRLGPKDAQPRDDPQRDLGAYAGIQPDPEGHVGHECPAWQTHRGTLLQRHAPTGDGRRRGHRSEAGTCDRRDLREAIEGHQSTACQTAPESQ